MHTNNNIINVKVYLFISSSSLNCWTDLYKLKQIPDNVSQGKTQSTISRNSVIWMNDKTSYRGHTLNEERKQQRRKWAKTQCGRVTCNAARLPGDGHFCRFFIASKRSSITSAWHRPHARVAHRTLFALSVRVVSICTRDCRGKAIAQRFL